MRNYLRLPHVYFGLFPTETVLASEVRPGDIIKYFNSWGLVIKNEYGGDNWNNGWNQMIHTMEGGGPYLKPDDEVTIILRSIIDQTKFKELVAQHLEDEKEKDRFRKEAEEEEKERIREMRDALNRELGDY